MHLPYSTRNPIEFPIPSLFYLDGGLLDIPSEDAPAQASRGPLATLLNIWTTDWIERSLEEGEYSMCDGSSVVTYVVWSTDRSSFSFLRFSDLSASEAHALHIKPLLQRRLISMEEEREAEVNRPYSSYVLFLTSPSNPLTNLIAQ